MTGSQKAIKIISIILIVVGIVALIAGLLTFAGGMALVGAGAEASSIDQQFYVSSAGLFFVLGAGALISGIFGLRGAKDPRKIGPFFVFSIIGLVLSILNLIISLTSGVSDLTTIGSNIVSVALLIGCVVLANKVRQIH